MSTYASVLVGSWGASLMTGRQKGELHRPLACAQKQWPFHFCLYKSLLAEEETKSTVMKTVASTAQGTERS